MVKTIYIFALLLFSVSCTKNNNNFTYSNEINNIVLINNIIEYKHFVDSLRNGKSTLIRVFCSSTNEQKTEFVIQPIADAYNLTAIPYQFKCRINQFDVYFTLKSCLVNSPDYGKTDLNFFKTKNEVLLLDVKKYFPLEYDSFLKYGSFTPTIIFEPELLQLIFDKNKLVYKKYKRSLERW